MKAPLSASGTDVIEVAQSGGDGGADLPALRMVHPLTRRIAAGEGALTR